MLYQITPGAQFEYSRFTNELVKVAVKAIEVWGDTEGGLSTAVTFSVQTVPFFAVTRTKDIGEFARNLGDVSARQTVCPALWSE
jgi:hypothetical protein